MMFLMIFDNLIKSMAGVLYYFHVEWLMVHN